MRSLCLVAIGLWLATSSLHADALSDARRFYNQGQFDAAERAAREAARVPASADAARMVLGRIQLERYRRAPVAADLSGAISAFASIDARRPGGASGSNSRSVSARRYISRIGSARPPRCSSRPRLVELLGPVAHERVLDWWATAVDRQAQLRPPAERGEMYRRISTAHGRGDLAGCGSIAAGYWLAASARGRGDLERALSEATAAWVRASLARDGGVALRADLDRLVVQGILPDRAARLTVRDNTQALAGMVGEWEAFKSSWSRWTRSSLGLVSKPDRGWPRTGRPAWRAGPSPVTEAFRPEHQVGLFADRSYAVETTGRRCYPPPRLLMGSRQGGADGNNDPFDRVYNRSRPRCFSHWSLGSTDGSWRLR